MQEPTEPGENPNSAPEGRRRVLSSVAMLVLIAVCVLVAAVGVAGAGGVAAGQKDRSVQATQTTTAQIDLQFNLGLQDLEAGHYGLAAQRFVWVLDRAPNYPGAADRLVEARQGGAAGTDATETPVPPSTAASLDDQFAEAQTFYQAHEWSAAISRLQAIQSRDPGYRTADVQQMLFDVLKTLGLSYVRGDRLEEGLFLLDQAKDIRPLDDTSEGERLLASFYVASRTYWNLNWPVVIQNLRAIYDVAPYYRDVESRLQDAHVSYGDQLALAGMPCEAADEYETALGMQWDSDIQGKYDETTYNCENPSPTPSPTLDLTAGTPTLGGPDATQDASGTTETPTPTLESTTSGGG